VEVRQTSNLRRLRIGEEKRRQKKKPQRLNIMAYPLLYIRGAITNKETDMGKTFSPPG